MVMDYQEDANGARYEFNYDQVNKKTTVTNRRGYKTTYHYNDRHLTEEAIDPYYHRETKVYDDNNNLTSVTDKRGYTTSYTYDENNNITSITDTAGTLSLTYNQFNKISTITNKNGYTTSFQYDNRGNLTTISYPDSSMRSFTYNNLGLLLTETDQRGNFIEYSYDQFGHLNEIKYPDGSKEVFEYDKVGRLLRKVDPLDGEIKFFYDQNDNIIKVIDQLGNEELFTYNDRGKTTEKTDPNGNTTYYEYDQRNNLKKIIDAAGNVKEIFFDEAENMTKKILDENISYVYSYDSLNRLISATQVETAIKTAYEYDPAGNLIAITDGEGKTTKYRYDALNRKISEIDPLNNEITYRYFPSNKIKSITDKKGNTTYFKYDSMNRLTEVINPLNQRIEYQYDKAGNLIAQTDFKGNKIHYEYDSLNRLIKKIDSMGYETKYMYDLAGNLVGIIDPEGNKTTYKYDLKGRMIEETNALGYSKIYEYDAMGNLICLINEAGVMTSYKYDGLNRLVEIENILGNKTKISYTPLGQVAWREDALGHRTKFDYDAAGRLIKKTDPEGNFVKYAYDKAGNMLSVTDELGNVTNYHYDKLNRMVEIVDALNNQAEYSYDNNGNLTEMVNKNGNKYQYEYDAIDRLVSEINYQGNEKNYSYDPNGNLIEKTDFNGNTINYNYDKLNRLLETIFSDGSKKEFSYNANGMLTEAINQNSNQRYYYDELSRLIKVEAVENGEGEHTVEFHYNGIGQKTKVIVNDQIALNERVTKYEYDELMRLNRVELPDGGEVKYRYDELNRIITKINGNSTGTSYTYNIGGQVESITHWKGLAGYNQQIVQSYGYLYNARDERVLQVEGNGEIQAFAYDPVGRLTKVYYPYADEKKIEDFKERFHYGLMPEWEEPFNYQLQLKDSLDWDKKNNLREQLDKMSTELDASLPGLSGEKQSELTITQDQVGLQFTNKLDISYQLQNKADVIYQQIRQNSNPLDFYGDNFWVEEFNYEPAGNVTEKVNGWGKIKYQYNDSNQLIKAGERGYLYDLNGNLIKEELGNYSAEYQYNEENRLIKVTNTSHPHFLGGEKPFKGEITYAYDALGRKANKVVDKLNGSKIDITGYIYDGLGVNVLTEYQVETFGGDHYETGTEYLNSYYDAGKIKGINEYYYGYGLIAMNYLNNPLQGRMKPDVSYYHKNALGSISMITGKNGQVVDRYEYDAYGNPYNGRFEQGNNMNPYGFTGQRYETEIGIYAFAYRHYNARSMRWMTVDPIKDGANWYSYVNGDPINLYDPLGLCDADPDSWRNVMKEQQPMMSGDDVEELQESLVQLGYDVGVDGYYGSQTAGAVKQYQQDKGLEADGVVGPNTRDAIKKDLGIEDESHEIYFSHDTDKVYWVDNEGNIDNSWQASDEFIHGTNKDGLPRESLPAGDYTSNALPKKNRGRAYGTSYIDTGDLRGRDLHGGGSELTPKSKESKHYANQEGAYAP